MSIIDFHSHILPGIDDGSQNIEMSEKILAISEAQNVNVIVATPHFYAASMTIDAFLKRRTAAYSNIRNAAAVHNIRIIEGAEVAFFPGIGDADKLEQLAITGTSLLLLEMPFRAWNSSDIKDVEKLLDRGLKPIIAHMERFYRYQKDTRMMDELYSLPVLVQVNAESLLGWITRRLALYLFQKGYADLLGTDCHNISSRPPNLAAGRDIIQKKLGAPYLTQLDQLGKEVLGLS